EARYYERLRTFNESVADLYAIALMHFNINDRFSRARRALTFGDFERAAETDLGIVSNQLDIEGVRAAGSSSVDLHGPDDQRTDDIDFWEQFELDTKAIGEYRPCGDEVCGPVACRPKVRGYVLNDATNLLAPITI